MCVEATLGIGSSCVGPWGAVSALRLKGACLHLGASQLRGSAVGGLGALPILFGVGPRGLQASPLGAKSLAGGLGGSWVPGSQGFGICLLVVAVTFGLAPCCLLLFWGPLVGRGGAFSSWPPSLSLSAWLPLSVQFLRGCSTVGTLVSWIPAWWGASVAAPHIIQLHPTLLHTRAHTHILTTRCYFVNYQFRLYVFLLSLRNHC